MNKMPSTISGRKAAGQNPAPQLFTSYDPALVQLLRFWMVEHDPMIPYMAHTSDSNLDKQRSGLVSSDPRADQPTSAGGKCRNGMPTDFPGSSTITPPLSPALAVALCMFIPLTYRWSATCCRG